MPYKLCYGMATSLENPTWEMVESALEEVGKPGCELVCLYRSDDEYVMCGGGQGGWYMCEKQEGVTKSGSFNIVHIVNHNYSDKDEIELLLGGSLEDWSKRIAIPLDAVKVIFREYLAGRNVDAGYGWER